MIDWLLWLLVAANILMLIRGQRRIRAKADEDRRITDLAFCAQSQRLKNAEARARGLERRLERLEGQRG